MAAASRSLMCGLRQAVAPWRSATVGSSASRLPFSRVAASGYRGAYCRTGGTLRPSGRMLHTTSPLGFSDAALSKDDEEAAEPVKLNRFVYTFEVTVSKLFPAGFGWQMSSCYAESIWGLEADNLGFFVVTGMGDFCGVFAGHFTYYTLKKWLYDPSIQIGANAHVALWLASAAAMSGGMWQPFVNFFQSKGVELSFNTACMATMICCGSMFYTGLRLGRYFYSPVLMGVPRGNYENLKTDAQLSVAIGGATACFVGTDISYGNENWLRPIIGVEEGMSDLHGSILAGTSTALGFFTVQTAQNIGYPMGTCWVD